MTYSWGRRAVASVLVGFSVAVIAHVANISAFVIAYLGTSTPPTWGLFAQVGGYFLLASVITFIGLAIAGLIGAFSHWWTALIAGIVVALIAVLANSVVPVFTAGTKISGTVLSSLFDTLAGINYLFCVLVAILTPTLGRWLYGKIVRYNGSRRSGATIALVRIPASNLTEGIVSHAEPQAVDAEVADQQWDAYVAALAAAGWRTIEVAPADKLADSVFIEDTAILFDDTAVIARSGAESRRDEVEATEASLRELGLDIARIEEPATLDGGDVLKVGSTVYVGRSERTNADGIRQLRGIVGALGYTVVAVPVTRALHLKSTATALPDGTIVGFEPLIDNSSLFDRFVAVPEATGAAVVVLDESTVLMSSSAPKSVELVENLGYTVTTVDISEFEKLDGGLTCLSIRIR